MTVNFNPGRPGAVNLPVNNEAGDRTIQRTRPDHDNRTRSTAAPDSVSLTKGSYFTRELEQRLANIPTVDTVRVEAFRKSIAQGNYRIDADMLAGNLIEMEFSLARTNGGGHD